MCAPLSPEGLAGPQWMEGALDGVSGDDPSTTSRSDLRRLVPPGTGAKRITRAVRGEAVFRC